VLRDDRPFNFSALNNLAAAEARGSLLGFVNNDIAVIEPGWLSEMVSLAIRPGIGAVGARLLYANGQVQHAGVVLGIGSVAGHLHRFAERDHPGYFGRALLAQELSAVTGACMLVPKAVFDRVGGFDAEKLPIAFNDIDLCLRIGAAGYRILWTPHATLFHYESSSRGFDDTREKRARFLKECDVMTARWGGRLSADPHFNPNLSLDFEQPVLAFPPRLPPFARAAGR
jgi:O-antigen biosynthesis protein